MEEIANNIAKLTSTITELVNYKEEIVRFMLIENRLSMNVRKQYINYHILVQSIVVTYWKHILHLIKT